VTPPHAFYRTAFLALALSVFAITYWAPVAGWWLCVALVPVANIPVRAFELGAHDALSFLALGCCLGWWAHVLVTRVRVPVRESIRTPLLLVLLLTAASMLVTILRYTDWYPLFNDVLRNGWVRWDGSADAVTAARMVLISGATALALPGLWWTGVGIALTQRRGEQSAKPWQHLALVWAIMLVPALVIAAYQSVFNPSFGMLFETAWQHARRVSGCLTDPNALGLFVMLALPLIGWAAWRTRGMPQMALACVALLGLYALTQSGSRSALLGMFMMLGCGCVVVAWRRTRHYSRMLRATVAVAVVCVMALTPVAAWLVMQSSRTAAENPVLQRMQEFAVRLRGNAPGNVIDSRELQWRQACAVWRDVPLTGIGVGAFAVELPNHNRAATRETPTDNAWNQYLQWLAEMGATGLGAWLWLLTVIVVAVARTFRHGVPAELTPAMHLAWLGVGALLALGMFGAHFTAPEVACGTAVVAALATATAVANTAESPPLDRRSLLVLAAVIGICIAAQINAALGPLSHRTLQTRFQLPREFGLYRPESWYNMFSYQWTQRYAGKLINIPTTQRVLTIRLAALQEQVSEAHPVYVRCWLDTEYLDTIKLVGPDWTEYSMYVYQAPPGDATLTLACSRTWRPPHEMPPRTLGVAVATDVTWDDSLRREGQGFSPWFHDTIAGTNVAARWTERRAARYLTVGPQGCLRIGLRAPADTPFFSTPPRVTVRFNGTVLKTITLPHRRAEWIWENLADDSIKAARGIVSFEVDRTTPIRMPGSVRRQHVGVALAEVATF
jgi:O-antigen ligase